MEETKNTYLHIIDDVIANSNSLFSEESFDTSILETLKALWIQKMMAAFGSDVAETNPCNTTDVSSTENAILQVDGANSSEESDRDADCASVNGRMTDEEQDQKSNNDSEEELNTEDDITDDDDDSTSNIILCQFDNVKKVRNLWKMSLSKGVMNIDGKEYVYNRAYGEAKW